MIDLIQASPGIVSCLPWLAFPSIEEAAAATPEGFEATRCGWCGRVHVMRLIEEKTARIEVLSKNLSVVTV